MSFLALAASDVIVVHITIVFTVLDAGDLGGKVSRNNLIPLLAIIIGHH